MSTKRGLISVPVHPPSPLVMCTTMSLAGLAASTEPPQTALDVDLVDSESFLALDAHAVVEAASAADNVTLRRDALQSVARALVSESWSFLIMGKLLFAGDAGRRAKSQRRAENSFSEAGGRVEHAIRVEDARANLRAEGLLRAVGGWEKEHGEIKTAELRAAERRQRRREADSVARSGPSGKCRSTHARALSRRM